MFGFGSNMIFNIPALLIALTVHEYAHARVAVALGDPTPRFMGRLTLNPIAHLDAIGLIMLWLFSFGWAKPVPVNPNNFKDGKKAMIWVSLAGPASNVAVAFVVALLHGLLVKLHVLTPFWANLIALTYIYNLMFAIFNLIPIPPLDGSKILMSLLPGKQAYALQSIEQYGTFILIALVYFGIVGAIARPIEQGVDVIIRMIVGVIF